MIGAPMGLPAGRVALPPRGGRDGPVLGGQYPAMG